MRMSMSLETPLQNTWGWKVAVDLFGAGMGAGAYALGMVALVTPGLASRGVALMAMWLGLAAVVLAAVFLLWDLERPERFLRVIFKVKRSWLARGAWIVGIFCVLAFLTLLLGTPMALGVLSLVAALAVTMYTGLLIGTMLARPLWNTPVLPVLFVAYSLSTGLALLVVGGAVLATGNAALGKDVAAAAAAFRPTQMWLLVVELALLYFYLSIAYGRSREAVQMLVRDRLARGFWIGVVTVGLLLPLLLQYVAAGAGAAALSYDVTAHVGVLIGGFLLRRLILAAGIRSVVQLSGPFIIRPEV